MRYQQCGHQYATDGGAAGALHGQQGQRHPRALVGDADEYRRQGIVHDAVVHARHASVSPPPSRRHLFNR
jgi:hypothetical protein